ncbi:MAG: ParA family protein [SAR324 cluster bacterium]|uniref:ParA family protein n=1 Tax=SAR324 cluster bacterium TaxID=2024889 RepID=A0A7X9ILN9_9DELT|nr:ParA family protein [SAR324 cluster bacterium]
MKVLVVDSPMESQVQVARIFDSLNQTDRDMLDIKLSLANEKTYLERISEIDVLVIGPNSISLSKEISHAAKNARPDINILIFVSNDFYSSESFRLGLTAKARKVLPMNVAPLDLLQEFLQIQELQRACGRAREGSVIVVTQVKGGLGATTLCAALGEACSKAQKKVLLWDLDIESKDLARSLLVQESRGSVMSSWVKGTREISRDSINDAIVSLDLNSNLLPPPDSMPSAMDLLGRMESENLARKIIDLSRIKNDCIIIDTCGRMCPLTGTLLRIADIVLVLIDDSILGLSAIPSFMKSIRQYILSNDVVRFLRTGTTMSAEKIRNRVDSEGLFGKVCWELPSMPFDIAAGEWPGSGKTLYSLGTKKTITAIDKLSNSLGLYQSPGLKSQIQKLSSSSRIRKILGIAKIGAQNKSEEITVDSLDA